MNSTESSDAFLNRVDCIDLQCGLEHVSGNRKLLHRLLSDFYQDHHHDAQRISQALDENRWTEARRFVHTIKGIAGTIGANPLYIKANDLEIAIVERKIRNVQGALDEFIKRFNELMRCLRRFKEEFTG